MLSKKAQKLICAFLLNITSGFSPFHIAPYYGIHALTAQNDIALLPD
jgi:hypothetical protein